MTASETAKPTTEPTAPVAPEPAQAKETDWKAEARKWEDRAKENKSASEELASIKAAQMTETERLNAQLTSAQQAAEKATADALRWRVAARHGISDDDAETFLTGSDEATLLRQAERLAALATVQSSTPAGPRPDLSQGAREALPLNSDGLTDSLKNALGIR